MSRTTRGTIDKIFKIHTNTLRGSQPTSSKQFKQAVSMKIAGKSIRPFIGARNFDISRNFYSDLGFDEIVISESLSFFRIQEFGFYLQNAYVKDWIDNSMIFYEVDNLETSLNHIKSLNLTEKYDGVRLSEIVFNEWGNEFFLHDPCGILWHFGIFHNY